MYQSPVTLYVQVVQEADEPLFSFIDNEQCGRYSQKSKVWPQYNEAPGISPSPRVEIVTVRFQPELNAERLWVLPLILTANSASFVMIRFER